MATQLNWWSDTVVLLSRNSLSLSSSPSRRALSAAPGGAARYTQATCQAECISSVKQPQPFLCSLGRNSPHRRCSARAARVTVEHGDLFKFLESGPDTRLAWLGSWWLGIESTANAGMITARLGSLRQWSHSSFDSWNLNSLRGPAQHGAYRDRATVTKFPSHVTMLISHGWW